MRLRAGLICAFFLLASVGVEPLRVPWWKLTGIVLRQLDRFNSFSNNVAIDFSAGQGSISSPERSTYGDPTIRNSYYVDGSNSTLVSEEKTQILLAHQMGKKLIKQLPDAALLGFLVLTASELLRREVDTNFVQLPPILRGAVNATASELEEKLEYLSSLKWSVEPFLRAEIENLQTQPLEVIDRFIVKELLPKIDKEFSPFLTSMVADPKQAKVVAKKIKDLIEVSTVLFLESKQEDGAPLTPLQKASLSPLQKTKDSIMRQIDSIGSYAEDVIGGWNKFLGDTVNSTKQETVLDREGIKKGLKSFDSFTLNSTISDLSAQLQVSMILVYARMKWLISFHGPNIYLLPLFNV